MQFFSMWYLNFVLIVLLNLLSVVWLTQIKYKRTLARRRKWKRYLALVFLVSLPALLLAYLFRFALVDVMIFCLCLIGIWFSLSQLKFAGKRSGVPKLVMPVATMFLILCTVLLLLTLFTAM